MKRGRPMTTKFSNSKRKNTRITPSTKPIYKKWWFLLLLFLLVAGIVRGFGDDKSSQTTAKKDSSSQVTKSNESTETTVSEENKSSKEKVPNVTHKMGETVKVGDVEYIVHAKSTSKTVGNELLGKTANGTYLILNVTVKNTGKKSINVTSNYFAILDGDTEYSDDSSAGFYVNKEGKFFLSEVNPGNSITGNVVFDLSDEALNSSNLQLQVQTGAWGTQKGLISLNE